MLCIELLRCFIEVRILGTPLLLSLIQRFLIQLIIDSVFQLHTFIDNIYSMDCHHITIVIENSIL